MVVNKLKELRSGGAEDGFTLIELMIVVVIIGILAAIAIPIFLNQQKSAVASSVKSDVRNTNTNVVTFLVTDPTADATALAAGVDTVVTDGNAVVVAGTWDAYTVTGSNTDAFGGAAADNQYVFTSATGQYTGTGIFA